MALVAAETPKPQQQAIRSIRVVYEDLPAIFDPEEALRPGALKIHDGGNLLGRRVTKRGNPDAAFKEADVIVDRIYTTPHIEHTYLEPDAGLAYMDHDGILNIYASTQNPHYDQKDVADLLGLEESRVRIIQAATGGGFGSKLGSQCPGFCRFGGLSAAKACPVGLHPRRGLSLHSQSPPSARYTIRAPRPGTVGLSWPMIASLETPGLTPHMGLRCWLGPRLMPPARTRCQMCISSRFSLIQIIQWPGP